MSLKFLRSLILALRPNQWVKNLILYAAIVLTGELFNFPLFLKSSFGFLIFCALSSASYLFNDLRDLPFDRLHPIKKNRPLASGLVSPSLAALTIILLAFFGLASALFFGFGFFLICLSFFLLHLLYSTIFKKYAIFDILSISASFFLRALAGEVLTGFHIPFWMMLTIAFLSLFIASCKRHSELLSTGGATRPTLFSYQEKLLHFYTSTFATATLLTYALFTFFAEPFSFSKPFSEILSFAIPAAPSRKWLMLTLPFVILGIMRYAQLTYEEKGGEEPEKVVTRDKLLLSSILSWGLMVILIIYLL